MMMTEYITKEGAEKLRSELEHLKNVRRKEVSERLRSAAAQGDLSENFDYSDAKEEQESVERRIAELEATLANATVVEKASQSGVVQIGSTLSLESEGETVSMTITGPQEANPLEGKISAQSPLGQALLGRKKGEKAEVEAPGGTRIFTILEIR